MRRSKVGHRIIGYLPLLSTQSKKTHLNFSKAVEDLRSACFRQLFSSVCAAYQAGGVYMNLLGKEICMLPVIPFIIQDTQEGNHLCQCSGYFLLV